MSGGLRGTVFALAEPSLTVGRADESLICIEDDQVSRHHALLTAEDGEYRVRDLNSANGTFVNGQRVTEAQLEPGDHLQFGSVELVYEKERAKPGGKPRSPVAPTLRSGLPPAIQPVVVLGSGVRAIPVAVPVAPGKALPPADARQSNRRAKLILGVGVGSAYFILMGWFAHRWIARRNDVPSQPVAPRMALPLTTAQRTYADPKGRFVCAVPAGWRVEEDSADPRSKVALVMGNEEIRVIAQPAVLAELEEADRTAAVQAFHRTIEQTRAGGASGRLLETRWREVRGVKALEVEVEVGAPRYFWMRQVRFRQGGADHTVALYVGSPEQREPLTALFESFLSSYRSPGQPASKLTARQP